MKVASKSKVPQNWIGFLRDESNKKELFSISHAKKFHLLTTEGKQVFVTSDVMAALMLSLK